MSGATTRVATPSFETTRETTRIKARGVLALVDQGLSVAAISVRLGPTEARIRQLLVIARAETAADSQGTEFARSAVAMPLLRKKISRRTMLERAWITMHIDRRLWTMDRGVRSFWLEVVMTIHQLGDADGLRFGRYGDGFESRAEFASAHDGTEAELEALFRRNLLVSLENGGIAFPSDIGLRPCGKPPVPSSSVFPLAAYRAAPARPAGKAPVPGQRAFVMGMPGRASDMAGEASGANSETSAAANPCENLRDENANICADVGQESANSYEIGGNSSLGGATTTTTEVSESLGGGSGNRAPSENLRAAENLRAESAPTVAKGSASDLAWVTLGAELVETAGLGRPLTVPEAELIGGWRAQLDRARIPALELR